MTQETLTFSSLEDVLKHLDGKSKDAEKAVGLYRSQLQELTGHDLSKPVTALDVVKIVQKVFFGGANGAANRNASPSADGQSALQPGAVHDAQVVFGGNPG